MFMTKMFWRSWEFTFLSPSSLLISCELFASMRVIHQKQLKLSELYATLYNSLCRCLIPPLYTMFMTTTLCHNCPFCWMLQVVTLCCLMLRHPYARNVSRFTLYCFMLKFLINFSITFSKLIYGELWKFQGEIKEIQWKLKNIYCKFWKKCIKLNLWHKAA